jgi:hypothetical protein
MAVFFQGWPRFDVHQTLSDTEARTAYDASLGGGRYGVPVDGGPGRPYTRAYPSYAGSTQNPWSVLCCWNLSSEFN